MGFMPSFWRDAQAWERPVKIGVGVGLILLLLLVLLTLNAPFEARPPLLIGVVALVFVIQGLILWGNRHLVTAYTRAQRQFLAEDYPAARQTLIAAVAEAEQKGKRPSVEVLTLLGNTLRNLGLLAESEDILTTALQRQPQNPFPLYGFGRTLLAVGRFAEAETYFQRAQAAGGPEGIRFDVALAQVYQGRFDEAAPVLHGIVLDSTQDVTRRWMAERLLSSSDVSLDEGHVSLSHDDRQLAEQFWQKEAARFGESLYGQWIQQLLDEKAQGVRE